MLNEKSQVVDALEVHVYEVEMQLDKMVKIIRSDRGSEYYEKYNEMGECAGPFENSLRNATYVRNMLCKAHHIKMVWQKGVIVDIVRSMMSNSSLPISLWMHALKLLDIY